MLCHLPALDPAPDVAERPHLNFCVNTTRIKLVFWLQMEAPKQVARRSDMDMNGHINNVTYLGWALETVPPHIADSSHLFQVCAEVCTRRQAGCATAPRNVRHARAGNRGR